MTALTRLERMDDLFPEFFRRWARPMQLGAETPSEIRIDVTENDKEYVVSAEIPGAKKDDIRVMVDGNYVSISAELKKDEEKKEGRMLVKETYRGSISRGFTLGHEVDDKAASAKLEDGVLHLTLPKRTSASSHLINVQ
ncbi:MAG: Hsp20/alpha crystallin family protein [Pseudomonadota bacterium]